MAPGCEAVSKLYGADLQLWASYSECPVPLQTWHTPLPKQRGQVRRVEAGDSLVMVPEITALGVGKVWNMCPEPSHFMHLPLPWQPAQSCFSPVLMASPFNLPPTCRMQSAVCLAILKLLHAAPESSRQRGFGVHPLSPIAAAL